MSLRPDDRSSRGRSKSPGRERSRSRSNVRAPTAPEPPSAVPRTSYVYPSSTQGPPMPGSFSNEPTYDVRAPSNASKGYPYPASSMAPPLPYSAGTTTSMPSMPYPEETGGFTMGGYTDLPPHERPGYVPPHQGQYPPPPIGGPPRRNKDDDLAYGDSDDDDRRGKLSRHSSSTAGYRYTPAAHGEPRPQQSQYQYSQAPGKLSYTARPTSSSPPAAQYSSAPYGQPPPHDLNYSSTVQGQSHEQLPRTYAHNAYDRDAHVVDITPGREKLDRHNSASKTARFSTNLESQQSASLMAPSLGPRMDRLSVSGNRPDLHGMGVGMAPPSPLLEAYHGTYQSISPMPLAIRPDDDDDFSDLEPLEPISSHNGRGSHRPNDKLAREVAERDRASTITSSSSKTKRSIRIYDGEEDAKAIASALNHHKPDADALCDIIPRLTHDHIMEVRKEYKKLVKVQGKGVNLSKHINMKLSGSMFGKAVYVTALGRWESEGYWANFFYQSHNARRELLIESLMGRTNGEIRMIKDEFKDKRYSDSLTKCMEKELKMDKFRTAVLMVLEERRQEEQDAYPMEYVHKDVDTLYRSVRADKGGESAMLDIIVRRSDAHLKEVLRAYEKTFGENFARAALRKSNNLVGEVIAHILNGVINRPARDAALLRHAIQDIADKNREDELRYELLISRLVRVHWERPHLMRVKKEFYEKYRVNLEDAVNDATKGDLREFLCELCETR